MQPILLDTCAIIFSVTQQLKTSASDILERVEQDDTGVFVSPISAWEIGLLVSRGQLIISTSPEIWFSAVLQAGAKLAPMGPDVLIASSFLPASGLRDPADRIIAATARICGYRLMTRDCPLLDYAAEGHLKAIAC